MGKIGCHTVDYFAIFILEEAMILFIFNHQSYRILCATSVLHRNYKVYTNEAIMVE